VPTNPAYWGNVLGLAAYALGGALLSGRLGARWVGVRWLFVTHEWLSWAVIVLGVAHGLLLMPRRSGGASFVTWWWPVGASTVPLAIAVGPFVVYALALVAASYYVRRRLGYPLWRWLHALAYPVLAVMLWHGIEAGPDAWHPVIRAGYGVALGAVAAGIGPRVAGTVRQAARRARRNASAR
jgi:predicted ferric reductase